MKGVKHDEHKPRMWLLPMQALYEVARVLTHGAEEYSPDNWKTVPNGYERYSSALLRHLTAIQKGEVYDPKSGLFHISHVACNALFLVHYTIKGKTND